MRKKANIDIKNKRASFDYEWVEQFTAGIVLQGTEVKAIREGKASLVDCFCFFQNNELWVKNMHISEYRFGTYANHYPKRDRKLLLQRRELRKLQRRVKEKGLTIIATRLFFNDNDFVKLNITLARGKKMYDKRESIKEKDLRRAAVNNE
ncbi:SsrA-binding protein [Bacteroidia bacterium]|nr:SsrA-binding protein [Bacteroidia bacterium]GHT80330.1 SsrA-binding protein [Bacteroidia bacterium]